mgnify:CR=1 FL=1
MEQNPLLALLDKHNMDEDDLGLFIESNGWKFVLDYLSTKYIEATDVVTGNGIAVSNSRKLEAANHMSIIRDISVYPQNALAILNQSGENDE